MANLTSILQVRLIDQVSGPAASAARSLAGIGAAVSGVNGRGMVGSVAGILTRTADAAEAASRRIRSAASSISSISFPLLFGAGIGAKSVYEFEKVANTVEAVTNITKEQREQLTRYVQSLNALFPFSNTQIMQSALELGRGGFNFEQIMGALKSTLNLALAGGIELRESSDIATNVLTAMRLPMRTTEQVSASLARVNDVLSLSANQSNINVRELGETFKYVGPMAAAAGMSVEQVAAAAMVMGNNGIRASEAGVALRSALVRMVKPTKDMQAVLARANIDIRDFVHGGRQISAQNIVDSLATDGIDAKPFAAQIEAALRDPSFARNLPGLTQRLTDIVAGGGAGAMDRSKLAENISDALTAAGSQVDLLGFVKKLQEKGVDLGEIARIFDARQGARLITLLAGFKDLGTFLQRLENEAKGSTDRAAAIMQQGVVGAWNRFTASIENLFLSIARSGVLQAATDALNGVAGAIERLSKVNPELLKLGTYGAMIVAAVGPAGIALAGLAKIIQGVAFAGAWAAGGAGAAAGASGVGAGAAAGAGAAGAVAAVSRWANIMAKLRIGGSLAGAWWLKGHLDRIDPNGNLWGLTGNVDRWIYNRFGVNPSNVFGGAPFSPTAGKAGTAPDRLAQLRERMRLRAMWGDDAGDAIADRAEMPAGGPSVPSVAAQAQQQAGEMASAGQVLGDSMLSAIEMQIKSRIPGIVGEISRQLSAITVSPTVNVRPRIDGSTINGVHGDIGVDVSR